MHVRKERYFLLLSPLCYFFDSFLLYYRYIGFCFSVHAWFVISFKRTNQQTHCRRYSRFTTKKVSWPSYDIEVFLWHFLITGS